MIARLILAGLVAGALVAAGRAAAEVTCRSSLALGVISGVDPPRLVFAQRAIDRAWGPSEDSVYTVVAVPQWKSEGVALALSAAVPGAGELYVGENSGYLYLLAETAGWVSRSLFQRHAREDRDNMTSFVGAPTLSSSGWSASRWSTATGGDASDLIALYQADPGAFLGLVASDDRYLAGWSGDAAATRQTFQGMRDAEQKMVRRSRYAEWALLLNHVVSAVDALRAARVHDLPLRRDLELRLDGNWHHGRPELVAALRRTF